MTLIHSALAGGDCIDDAAALRAGDTQAVLGHGVLAPSTLGTFLRSCTWGHARQLDRVSGELLARAWAAGAGPGDEPVTVDVDSTICETYGLAKQGGVFGHTHVRGYHPLLAAIAGTGDVVHCRLRGGNAHTGRGAKSFVTETFKRLRAADATGPMTLRADSGFYNRNVVDACRNAGARFSITVKLTKALHTAIAAIPPDVWVPIPYFLEDGADVAETTYRPFGQHQPDVRLIVRRVRPTPGTQLALFVEFSYHAFITDRTGGMLELEADHRRHADIENTIRDLKYGVGCNHLPSGRFGANAAWLALNVIAHNLSRWVGRIGLDEPLVTHKTLRRRYFESPAGSPAPPAAKHCTSLNDGRGPMRSTRRSRTCAPSRWSPELTRPSSAPARPTIARGRTRPTTSMCSRAHATTDNNTTLRAPTGTTREPIHLTPSAPSPTTTHHSDPIGGSGLSLDRAPVGR
jgi:hypothetical protein